MAKRIIPQQGQSLFDIAIQELGTADAAFDIAEANNITVVDVLEDGVILTIPQKEYGAKAKNIAEIFKAENLHPATIAILPDILIVPDTPPSGGDVLITN